MAFWEYIVVDDWETGSKEDYSLPSDLNKLGDDRWELVTVLVNHLRDNHPTYRWLFKRKL